MDKMIELMKMKKMMMIKSTNSICQCHYNINNNNSDYLDDDDDHNVNDDDDGVGDGSGGGLLYHLIDLNHDDQNDDNDNDHYLKYHQRQQQRRIQTFIQNVMSIYNYYYYYFASNRNRIKNFIVYNHLSLNHYNNYYKEQFILSSSSTSTSSISDGCFRFPSIYFYYFISSYCHSSLLIDKLFNINCCCLLTSSSSLLLINNNNNSNNNAMNTMNTDTNNGESHFKSSPKTSFIYRLNNCNYVNIRKSSSNRHYSSTLFVVLILSTLIFCFNSFASSSSMNVIEKFKSDNLTSSSSSFSPSSSTTVSSLFIHNFLQQSTTITTTTTMSNCSNDDDDNNSENNNYVWSMSKQNDQIFDQSKLDSNINFDLNKIVDSTNCDDNLTENIDDDDDDFMIISDDTIDDVPADDHEHRSNNRPVRHNVKLSSSEEDSDNDSEQQQQQQQQNSLINDNIDYVMHSPRTITTKYGALQGIVITFVRYNNDDNTNSDVNSEKFSSNNRSSSSSSPIVTLSPVEAFLGVPYATPPTGSLRFMPPVAPVHWRGVRQANHLSPVCPQSLPYKSLNISSSSSSTTEDDNSELRRKNLFISPKHYERLQRQLPFLRNQSEDCLYLNIYVPFEQYYQQYRLYQRQRHQQQKNNQQQQQQPPEVNRKFKSATSSKEINTNHRNSNQKQLYPVIVFISSDSYQTGSGNSFDASIWASYGRVIVVTLNFRLGVFGFLPASVDGTVRGNYGLMDQVAALHWIQENIAEFGGEPNNVTLIGHGFGASCVHLLMLSPMAKGLFSRVALLSGSALAPSAIARESEQNARMLAKELNCQFYDNTQLVDCLKRKPFEDLLRAIDQIHISKYLSPFGPIIDGIVVVEEPRIMMESMVYGPLSSASSLSSSKNILSSSASSTLSSNHIFYKNVAASSSSSSSSADLFAANHFHGDILFGVTKVQCPLDVFSGYEERYGISVERRNQILRTLIRNLFDFHQQTIFWTLINEYTDWSRPSEHPINLLDSTIDILGHALILAPLIETLDLYAKTMADRYPYEMNTNENSRIDFAYRSHNDQQHRHHSSKSGKIFFYVFQDQIKSILSELSTFNNSMVTSGQLQSIDQRLGSMLNDELDYLFGAPIAQLVTGHSIGHFRTNWSGFDGSVHNHPNNLYENFLTNQNNLLSSTKTQEVCNDCIHLSQMLITYFSNFAKYGNPNFNGGLSSSNNNQQQHNHNNNHQKHLNNDDNLNDISKPNTLNLYNNNANSDDNNNNEFRTSFSPIQQQQSYLNWPRYTVGQQRYLLIGNKPRLRDHYQSHRLSFWLNLIPHLIQDQYDHSFNRKRLINNKKIIGSDLDHSSFEDLEGLRYIRHHLLDNFDDEDSYDGHVRQITFEPDIHGRHNAPQFNSIKNNIKSIVKSKFPDKWTSSNSLFRMNSYDQSLNNSDYSFVNEQFRIKGSISGQQHIAFKDNLQQNEMDNSNTTSSKRHSGGDSSNSDSSHNLLQATIAIGCTLLALNLLVFAGVYYNLQKQNSVPNNSSTQNSIVDSTSCTQFVKMDEHVIINDHQQSSGQNQFGQHQNCLSDSLGILCTANSNYHDNTHNNSNNIDGQQHIMNHLHYGDRVPTDTMRSHEQAPIQHQCSLMNNHDANICQSRTSNTHHQSYHHTHNNNNLQQSEQQQHTHAQYFPLHTYLSSNGGLTAMTGDCTSNTTNNQITNTATNDSATISSSSLIPNMPIEQSTMNRTIRFNLSTLSTCKDDDEQSSFDDDDNDDHHATLLVPSAAASSSSLSNDNVCSNINNNNNNNSTNILMQSNYMIDYSQQQQHQHQSDDIINQQQQQQQQHHDCGTLKKLKI